MKAIVTGADGFVGSYVVKELLNYGYDVVAVDLGLKPRRLDSSEHLHYVSLSIDRIDELRGLAQKLSVLTSFFTSLGAVQPVLNGVTKQSN